MYVKVTDGAFSKYPYTIKNLKADNPNTGFPKVMSDDALAEWGVYPVTTNDKPSYNEATQKIVQNDPVDIDGAWTITFTVSDKTEEEVTSSNAEMAEMNRNLRDAYLADTDWWAVSDGTMAAERTSYRQALRDITAHANWPYLNDDDWPTKP